jgi:hypothetical protein
MEGIRRGMGEMCIVMCSSLMAAVVFIPFVGGLDYAVLDSGLWVTNTHITQHTKRVRKPTNK